MPEGDFIMSDFGEKLTELRHKSKLSLKEICEQTGIPPSRLVIEHLENVYGIDSGGLAGLSQEAANTDW